MPPKPMELMKGSGVEFYNIDFSLQNQLRLAGASVPQSLQDQVPYTYLYTCRDSLHGAGSAAQRESASAKSSRSSLVSARRHVTVLRAG